MQTQSSTMVRGTPASALVFGEYPWPVANAIAEALQAVPPTTTAPRPTVTAPPRTAVTADLTQPEVSQLAAVRFRNAADIDTFFRRSGQAGFIDWYNAGLAHSTPFSARGAIGTSQLVRDRFTAFWNQVQAAFDRAE